MPQASIVIPVFNRASLTRQCLDGLLSAAETRHCELIVVDDCSQDGTSELLAGYGEAIRTIRHPVNMGYGQGVNDGTALATSDVVVHLNNDTIPVAGWFDALIRYAEQNPKAAAVGSKLLNVDGSIQHAGIVFCSQHRPWHLYRWFPADHPAVQKSRRFQAVTSTCLLVRKEAFQRVGGFDSSMRNSYNDVDFCLRLGQHGYEVHFCHDSVLYHLEGASKFGQSGDDENSRRFRERWGDFIREDEWEYYVRDGLLRIARHNDILEFQISPVVGRVNGEGYLRDVDAIRLRQSQQIALLLREYISLRLESAKADGKEIPQSQLPLNAPEQVVMHAPSMIWPHQQLATLAANVLDHDAVRAERDALLERVNRFRNSLPGKVFLGLQRLLQRK